jgi:hypothetical protein
MSGPQRPTLCKPEHASRARELCARGATHSKTSGGKGGKGGNLQSLGNSGLFEDGAMWRKLAETPAETFLENCRQFCCLT